MHVMIGFKKNAAVSVKEAKLMSRRSPSRVRGLPGPADSSHSTISGGHIASEKIRNRVGSAFQKLHFYSR
jgi:hypothetical protein